MDILNAIGNLIVEIVGENYSVSIRDAAKEVLRQLTDLGVQITQQVIEQVNTFLSKVRQGTEWAFEKTKDAFYKMWHSEMVDCAAAGVEFSMTAPRSFLKSVVVFGLNCVRCCLGQITGQDLINQTCQSVDNIMNPHREPLVGAVAGAVTGAAIGSVVPVVGTGLGIFAGYVIGSVVGAAVARKNKFE